MPASYVGPRLSLIIPLPTAIGGASGTLQITSGAQTLVNRGTTAVTVTDGASPVTGCTLVVSDGTKATATGQNVFGKAESGTYTVTATKAGYTNSSPVTFTCSGGWILGLDPFLGTNTTTNGAGVTSWTDQSSTAAAFTEATNPPTYLSSGLNSAPAIRFNGTSQLLSTATVVAGLNPNNITLIAGIQTSSDGGVTNRSFWGNNSASFLGTSMLVNTSNQLRWTVGTGSTSASISGGSILMASGHYVTCLYDSIGAQQNARVDGIALTGQGTGGSPNTATAARLGANNLGTGNFFPGDYYYLLGYNRVLTATEITQGELTVRLRMGL